MTFLPAADRYKAMQYRRTGRSGLPLPAVSLDLWQNFGGDRSLETQRAIIRRAFDLGITHFHLANNYGPPYRMGLEYVDIFDTAVRQGKALYVGISSYSAGTRALRDSVEITVGKQSLREWREHDAADPLLAEDVEERAKRLLERRRAQATCRIQPSSTTVGG